MKPRKLLAIPAIVVLSVSQSFGYYAYLVESRTATGAQSQLFTYSGLATTSAKSAATIPVAWGGGGSLSGSGSYYGGQTTPPKTGDWWYTPDASHGGYYDVFATWALNTSAAILAPTWTVHNAGADVSTTLSQASGGNGWNEVAGGVKLFPSVPYSVKLATNPDDEAGKRTYFDTVAWAASTPGPVTPIWPPDGTSIGWTPGSCDSYFNVWFGTSPGSLSEIGAHLDESTHSMDLGGLNLQEGSTYYLRVDAGNLDRITQGTVLSLTVPVPEPSSAALGLLGGFALAIRALSRRGH